MNPTLTDLELYADRLARHADRLVDDISAARIRRTWATHEAACIDVMTAADVRTLEAVGVLAGRDDHDDADLISRRVTQLAALERLQDYTQRAIADARKAGAPL